jgi:hypothetical protein
MEIMSTTPVYTGHPQDAARRSGQRDADGLNSLAAASAEAGRFPDAVDTAERALDLARATGRTRLVTASAERLARHRAGLPVREPAGDTGL